jgi:hypothetical protein
MNDQPVGCMLTNLVRLYGRALLEMPPTETGDGEEVNSCLAGSVRGATCGTSRGDNPAGPVEHWGRRCDIVDFVVKRNHNMWNLSHEVQRSEGSRALVVRIRILVDEGFAANDCETWPRPGARIHETGEPQDPTLKSLTNSCTGPLS